MKIKPFEYLKLNISFEDFEKEIYPHFIGTFIRGNFGMYLKKLSCPFSGKRNCDRCILRDKCFYYKIFETKVENNPKGQYIPHPFVLETSFFEKELLKDLSFDIILFGPALENYEYFLLVFSEMGKKGLGRKRIKASKTIIKDETGDIVYQSGDDKILKKPEINKYEFKKYKSVREIIVDFDSPTRIQNLGKTLTKGFEYQYLIRALMRRISMLYDYYNGGMEINGIEVLEDSKSIKLKKEMIKWITIKRYSSRKKQSQNLGGAVGSLIYEGFIPAFYINLFKFAEIFHLGRNTAFGHGKIRLKNIENI